jgi:hypothetical protein
MVAVDTVAVGGNRVDHKRVEAVHRAVVVVHNPFAHRMVEMGTVPVAGYRAEMNIVSAHRVETDFVDMAMKLVGTVVER